jgi:CRAL/TRIO domain
MRHKEIHGLKVHPSIKFAVDFALSQMSDKMRKRVSLHRKVTDVTSVIDTSLLPAEYGGKIPMKDMINSFKKELEAHSHFLRKNDEMSVNLEMYPQAVVTGSVRSLKKTIDSFDEKETNTLQSSGVQGSFRKLEID